jgi:peptide/nickel transport system ATP-binding protein
MSALSFEAVTVRYGTGRHSMVAVDGVNLEVPAGKVVGLVGESGSGKSSLARAAVGLAPVSGGRILLDGRPVPRPTARRSPRIQMVFQDPYASLDPRMTVGASIREPMTRAQRRDRRGAEEETTRLLTLVNLDPSCAAALPSELSGGQRQRVALARALAGRPQVVVADEITSALDVSVQGTVLNLVRDLQRELDLSLLFISHNLAVVRYVSDVIAVMYLGQIVEAGPTEQVLADPQHPYTQQLLRAIPRRGGSLLASSQAEAPIEALAAAEPADPHAPPSGCRFHPRCPVGPLVHADRGICREIDPRIGADARRNEAACLFASSATSVSH